VPDPIKVAVLGFWHVHCSGVRGTGSAASGTELVAAWDDDAARGRAGADTVGASFVADLDDLLDRDDIDAVTVTTATTAHRALMLRVVQAGKHIFTEKLLAPTVAEAEEIIAAADQAGIALVVSLPRLYHGYTRAL
jgi:predicted dehydrogenase